MSRADDRAAIRWNTGINAIVAPSDTRRVLALSLEARVNIGGLPTLKTGVFQV